jgi:putative spermidine/putrescine transport system ATP-binding protein
MTYLNLRGVRKAFGASVAVQDFNLNIEQGEFVTFLGPSGCGKTTVLRMIAGFERPTAGQIVLADQDVTTIPASKRNVGMVFQQYALFPNMNVADNIRFGLKIRGESASVQNDRMHEMLDIIHMRDFAGRYPHQLSGGQQQRVALARALAIRPQVLLLDEPLSALDAKIRVSLREEIRAIQRRLSITTVFVTHDQEEALSISDRVVVMYKGRVEQVGAPSAIYNYPGTRFVASFVGTLNVLTAEGGSPLRIDNQPVHVAEAVPAGQEVTVAIRPEALSLTHQPGANGNQLSGTVDDVHFLGSVVRMRVRLESQRINVDMFNNPGAALPPVGAPVTLYFAQDACTVLHDSAS